MELLVYVKPILKKNSQKAGASSNKYNTCEKIAKFETIFLYGRLGELGIGELDSLLNGCFEFWLQFFQALLFEVGERTQTQNFFYTILSEPHLQTRQNFLF